MLFMMKPFEAYYGAALGVKAFPGGNAFAGSGAGCIVAGPTDIIEFFLFKA